MPRASYVNTTKTEKHCTLLCDSTGCQGAVAGPDWATSAGSHFLPKPYFLALQYEAGLDGELVGPRRALLSFKSLVLHCSVD